MYFIDRRDAGKQLAVALEKYSQQPNTLIIAIPRGGVPVADEVATALQQPLDIMVTKKIGAPGNPEFAIGSVGIEGDVNLDMHVLKRLGITPEGLQQEIEGLKHAIQEKLEFLRGKRDALSVKGKHIILIDDGIATGNTLKAAIQTLQKWGAEKIILASPVGAEDSVRELNELTDEMHVLYAPVMFHAVGQFYEEFDQTPDQEVIEILEAHAEKKSK